MNGLLMEAAATSGHWLPVAFAALMGLAILAYVVLDGYDLGVGILMGGASEAERDRMVASIGPFWDANETWLVLAVGLLLVAFPAANGVILGALYLPVTVMLIGLTLRGVAFEFRAKAAPAAKPWWNRTFVGGSLTAALSQGYMLGAYILGFEPGWATAGFGALVAVCLTAAYALIGATWLILKTEGPLQRRAIDWAQRTLWLAALGMAAISAATPLVSERIFAKWFAWPELFLLLPIPAVTVGLFVLLGLLLRRMPLAGDGLSWLPFAMVIAIFALGFHGLAYSFYPFVVPERMTVWQAASAPESLMIIFVGALVVLPMVVGNSLLVYRVFRGKATELTYG